jgi:hypothetical protein
MELALFLGPGDAGDVAKLRSGGWSVRQSSDVARSPNEYRSYIQRSYGEFSCAKPSCMRFENAWMSDRTLCYLASGKPAVVQNTGPSSYLPSGEGLFRFSSKEEAVEAIGTINANYEHHSVAARELVESTFDATPVVRSILERALASEPKGAGFESAEVGQRVLP